MGYSIYPLYRGLPIFLQAFFDESRDCYLSSLTGSFTVVVTAIAAEIATGHTAASSVELVVIVKAEEGAAQKPLVLNSVDDGGGSTVFSALNRGSTQTAEQAGLDATQGPSDASIIVSSKMRQAVDHMGPRPGIFGFASGKLVAEVPVIDWSEFSAHGRSGAEVGSFNRNDNWVPEFLGARSTQRDMLQTTGLKIVLGNDVKS